MEPIETARLRLRNFRPDDDAGLLRMVRQYEASGLAVYDQAWPTDPAAIRGVAEWFAGSDQFMAVCLRDTGAFLGFVALNPDGPPDQSTLNLGYCFDFDHHGQGYATEACRAALRRAFVDLCAVRVVTGTADANQASVRLLERLGFRRTGSHVGSFRNDADGRPIEFAGGSYVLPRDAWEQAGGADRLQDRATPQRPLSPSRRMSRRRG